MSVVVDFPFAKTREKKANEEGDISLAGRGSEIRALLTGNSAMAADDQILVAKAIWRLLDRLEKAGVTKRQVLQLAGISQGSDSTKHLGQFSLHVEKDCNDKSAKRLNKKPSRYIAIIDAAAKLANLNSDAEVFEAFSETFYAAPLYVCAPDEKFVDLASNITEMVTALSKKYDLGKYFSAVSYAGVSLQICDSPIEIKGHEIKSDDLEASFMPGTFPHDWPITFYKYNNDCRHHDQSETIPPYPSVILGIWRVEESVLFHYDYEDDYSPEGDLNPPCSRGTVDGEIEIELRLCIIPVGVELRAEAALRVTISVDLSIPILNSVSLKGFFLKGFLPTSIPCSINYCAVDGDYSGQNYRVWRNTPSLVMPLEKYFVNRNTEFCRSCIFIPIKGVVLQDWLDRSDWFDAADLWWNYPTHVRWLGCSILQTYCPDNFSPFKSNTIAAALYRCLFEVTAVNVFDLLERKCSQLVCLFEGAVSRAKASDTANIVRFKDRIQQTLDDGSR